MNNLKDIIIKGLIIGEYKEILNKQINNTNKIGDIITMLKCVSIDDYITFNERLNYGTNWEQHTINQMQEKNKGISYYLINEKNVRGDILAIKGNKQTYIEVKSETVTNMYERIFIKAKQYNKNTNQWDNANLLSGSNNDYWVHYFLYNDRWHYMFTTKGKLKELCNRCGTLKTINVNHPYKTAQQGYLIDVKDLDYKEVNLMMQL